MFTPTAEYSTDAASMEFHEPVHTSSDSCRAYYACYSPWQTYRLPPPPRGKPANVFLLYLGLAGRYTWQFHFLK